MNNLVKVFLIVPFIGGCASINVGNYPENWGKVDLNEVKLLNGTFECKGESKSYYFMNVSTNAFLPYLLDVDKRNYRKCTSVSLTQNDTSSLIVNINYKNGSMSKTLRNELDYHYEDGWYLFKKMPYRPLLSPAPSTGTKRVSFAINSSDKLVAKISKSGIGLLPFGLPAVEASDEWNVFDRM